MTITNWHGLPSLRMRKPRIGLWRPQMVESEEIIRKVGPQTNTRGPTWYGSGSDRLTSERSESAQASLSFLGGDRALHGVPRTRSYIFGNPRTFSESREGRPLDLDPAVEPWGCKKAASSLTRGGAFWSGAPEERPYLQREEQKHHCGCNPVRGTAEINTSDGATYRTRTCNQRIMSPLL